MIYKIFIYLKNKIFKFILLIATVIIGFVSFWATVLLLRMLLGVK